MLTSTQKQSLHRLLDLLLASHMGWCMQVRYMGGGHHHWWWCTTSGIHRYDTVPHMHLITQPSMDETWLTSIHNVATYNVPAWPKNPHVCFRCDQNKNPRKHSSFICSSDTLRRLIGSISADWIFAPISWEHLFLNKQQRMLGGKLWLWQRSSAQQS